LECSGLRELGMGRERVDGEIQSGVKPPQSKKEGSAISREDAKTRRKGRKRGSSLTRRRGGLGIEFRSCPSRFGAMREPWSALAGRSLGWGRAGRWENPKRCQATAVQERRIRNLTRRREDVHVVGVIGVSPIILMFLIGRKRVSRGDAETRRVGGRVLQLPKPFWGHEGVLE
jgi:hypothetical protein